MNIKTCSQKKKYIYVKVNIQLDVSLDINQMCGQISTQSNTYMVLSFMPRAAHWKFSMVLLTVWC